MSSDHSNGSGGEGSGPSSSSRPGTVTIYRVKDGERKRKFIIDQHIKSFLNNE